MIVESLNMQIIMIYLEKLAQYVKKINNIWQPKKVGPYGEATKIVYDYPENEDDDKLF